MDMMRLRVVIRFVMRTKRKAKAERKNKIKGKTKTNKVGPEIISIKLSYFSSIHYHTFHGPNVTGVNFGLSPKFAYPPC
jgi:hypothetical protein